MIRGGSSSKPTPTHCRRTQEHSPSLSHTHFLFCCLRLLFIRRCRRLRQWEGSACSVIIRIMHISHLVKLLESSPSPPPPTASCCSPWLGCTGLPRFLGCGGGPGPGPPAPSLHPPLIPCPLLTSSSTHWPPTHGVTSSLSPTTLPWAPLFPPTSCHPCLISALSLSLSPP